MENNRTAPHAFIANMPAHTKRSGQRAVCHTHAIVASAITALFTLTCFATPTQQQHGAPACFIRGISLGHVVGRGSNAVLERRLREIVALGATHVSLVVTWSTPSVRSTRITRKSKRTPSDVSIIRILTRAQALGLHVMLVPVVDIQHHRPLEWRGALRPHNWAQWWRSYRRFILHYAKLSAGRAAIFSVGSELVTTEQMHSRWESLISEVREIFHGKLVYSANWDHFKQVTFWNLVDIVGITGYYRIAKARDVPESQMIALWKHHRRRLIHWSKTFGRPFLFTEVGYPSVDGGAMYPWNCPRRGNVDLEEQRRAYSAFVNAWRNVSALQGVFFWNWHGKGGKRDWRFTPRGKPAEQTIRDWFVVLRQKSERHCD